MMTSLRHLVLIVLPCDTSGSSEMVECCTTVSQGNRVQDLARACFFFLFLCFSFLFYGSVTETWVTHHPFIVLSPVKRHGGIILVASVRSYNIESCFSEH